MSSLASSTDYTKLNSSYDYEGAALEAISASDDMPVAHAANALLKAQAFATLALMSELRDVRVDGVAVAMA